MNAIETLKKSLNWPEIRRRIILHDQNNAAKRCRKYIQSKEITDYLSQIKVGHPELIGQKIIWQYWKQGFKNAPDLVQLCTRSVDRYCSDCKVIRLDDVNLEQYLSFPDKLKIKLKSLSCTSWSDALRMCLLSLYGGCWLDATVFLTDNFPSRYWEFPFFLYQRDVEERRKEYWENVFALYFGWGRGFKVNILNSILFSKSNNEWVRSYTNVLLNILVREKELHYFMSQILFNEYIAIHSNEIPVESDCVPHYLQQYINDSRFSLASFDEILDYTPIHKLTYKSADIALNLKLLFPEYS